MFRKVILTISIILSIGIALHAQMIQEEVEEIQTVDLNIKYRYPFSFGFDYVSLSPTTFAGTDFGGDFTLTDFSLTGRLPLKSIPTLQPTLRVGLQNISSKDPDDADLITRLGNGRRNDDQAGNCRHG